MNIKNVNKMLALIIGIAFPAMVLAEFEIPAGVPDPMTTWAPESGDNLVHPINGVAPESWQAAKDAGLPAYYIDMTSSAATNSNNVYGSPSKPRYSIPETTYPEGAYVEIHGGPYNGGGQIIFKGNGSPSKPVWFRGPSVDNKAIINGEMIVKGQYIFIENLSFIDRKPLSLRTHDNSTLSNLVVRHSSFSGDGTDGRGAAIPIYSTSATQRFHDILIYSNEISQMGNDYDDVDTSLGLSNENDVHGVHPDINVDRVWVLNNHIHHMGGDSIQVGRASTGDANRPTHVYIAGNDFHSNLENGVDIKEADYTLVINNKINNWRHHTGNPSTGAAVVLHNKATNSWIVNNEIYDAAYGIVASDGCTNTWVVGNVFYDIKHALWDTSWDSQSIYSGGSSIHFRGGTSGGILNNTMINVDKGIESSGGGNQIVNNIIYERNETTTFDINIGTSQANNLISSNLIYHGNDKEDFNNAECVACVYSDPNFKAGEKGQHYFTNDGSPAIAAGISIEQVLAQYESTFNTKLSVDIHGNDRLAGAIDIGAYENPNSSQLPSVSIPNPPSIVDIVIN